MNYIKGKIKKTIFYNQESGFVVALFRVKETNVKKLEVNKTITVTGTVLDLNLDIPMTIYGDYVKNDKWGMQFVIDKVEVEMPTSKEAIEDFLASSFIAGCLTLFIISDLHLFLIRLSMSFTVISLYSPVIESISI